MYTFTCSSNCCFKHNYNFWEKSSVFVVCCVVVLFYNLFCFFYFLLTQTRTCSNNTFFRSTKLYFIFWFFFLCCCCFFQFNFVKRFYTTHNYKVFNLLMLFWFGIGRVSGNSNEFLKWPQLCSKLNLYSFITGFNSLCFIRKIPKIFISVQTDTSHPKRSARNGLCRHTEWKIQKIDFLSVFIFSSCCSDRFWTKCGEIRFKNKTRSFSANQGIKFPRNSLVSVWNYY